MSIRRSNLDWARDIARLYRTALRSADPVRCAELDELARKRGQHWAAPTLLPKAAVELGMDSVMSAKQIEEFWGVPAHTIWGWKAKGLLKDRGEPGAPRFLVQDVFDAEARRRRTA